MTQPGRVWIGGGTCAGKSTVAEELVRGTKWVPFSCDELFWDHADSLPGSKTARAAAMPVWERLGQPVDEQVADVFDIAAERWPLTLADLAASPWSRIVEGESILPPALADLGVPATDAVFLIVPPRVRRERYAARQWASDIVAACPDPAVAMEAWMLRDDLVQARIVTDARACGYSVFDATDSRDLAAAADQVRSAIARA